MDSRLPLAELTLFQPNVAPTHHTIATELVTMGRATDCTIPIKDRFLSRRHAEIVFTGGSWVLRDCGSANGTFLNGVRVDQEIPLKPGDRISLGDSEVVFSPSETEHDSQVSFIDSRPAATISIPIKKLMEEEATASRSVDRDRLQVLNQLAMELIEDRPLSELFDFIVERVMAILKPSRAALAILAEDRKSFVTVKMRRRDDADSKELTISRTLLKEVVEEKKVLSFIDTAENEKLGQALSIIGQSIRSALCAPLVIDETVTGVLYVDYLLSQATITEDDVRLMGQVARFAAVKLETTRLRESAVAKQRLDAELKTAYTIQSRLLPAAPPQIEGYSFAGINHPCRTVSGDYYDFVIMPDGRMYFVVGDVSGKGITAALIMSSLATAFNIFAKDAPSPGELLSRLNNALAPKTAPTKFVTMFAGLIDPGTGKIQYANAGHTPPLWIREDGINVLRATDIVVGLFPNASYRTQEIELTAGDSLVLFTDGIIEAENPEGEEFGSQRALDCVAGSFGADASTLVSTMEAAVRDFVGTAPQGDDITILSMTRR